MIHTRDSNSSVNRKVLVVCAYFAPTLILAIYMIVVEPYGGLEISLRVRNAVELSATIPIELAQYAGVITKQEIWSELAVSILCWTVIVALLVCTNIYRWNMKLHVCMGVVILLLNFYRFVSLSAY